MSGSKSEFTDKDWRVAYAKRWWQWQEKTGFLTEGQEKNKEKTLRQWANQFHLIADRYSKDKLDRVLWYMFKENPYWVKKGRIRQPGKLLSEHYELVNSTYFEAFLTEADNELQLPQQCYEFELDDLVEKHGPEVKEKYECTGYGKGMYSDVRIMELKNGE